jgi:uncharacterized protein with von Willebrand factor type A (vWA) domain
MQNLKNYENFNQVEIQESDEMMAMQTEGAMSPEAKMQLEKLCEEVLCKEAQAYHDDENPEHTYEGYMNECMSYINEVMGQSGYSTIDKPYAD